MVLNSANGECIWSIVRGIYTTLWDTNFEDCGECDVTYPCWLETAGQEVKDLVADGAAESYVPGFGDMFGWNYGVEARTIVNKLCDVGGLASQWLVSGQG